MHYRKTEVGIDLTMDKQSDSRSDGIDIKTDRQKDRR
jgi:hypothetical protein